MESYLNDSTKIMLVSTSYPENVMDWKSVFISQMLHALSKRTNQRMCYWGPFGELPENCQYLCNDKERGWLEWLMSKGGVIHLWRQKGFQRFFVPIKLLVLLKKAYKKQDDISLFHINWLQNALPLLGMSTSQPIVINVLGSDLGLLRIPGMTKLLRCVFKNRSCVLAPNAEWMQQDLQKLFGDVTKIITVPLGINNAWFEVKKIWLSELPKKWIVVSRLTEKKIGPLFNWGEKIFSCGTGQELHLFGPMQESLMVPDWIHYHGPTNPDDLCNEWFPKAAGLITLSQHDEGRPQIMLEAMAAGLPIIASGLPAHSDFLTHRKTGWLVDSKRDFEEGVGWLSVSRNNKMIAQNARQWVKKEVGTWDGCAGRYMHVYNMLLSGEI